MSQSLACLKHSVKISANSDQKIQSYDISKFTTVTVVNLSQHGLFWPWPKFGKFQLLLSFDLKELQKCYAYQSISTLQFRDKLILTFFCMRSVWPVICQKKRAKRGQFFSVISPDIQRFMVKSNKIHERVTPSSTFVLISKAKRSRVAEFPYTTHTKTIFENMINEPTMNRRRSFV